jgi:alkanesulfonate monooxygenase SsuD/methylene tetrahydromethanopterin reductase-like flavin-dependent oxidoreductase (luciferase family)
LQVGLTPWQVGPGLNADILCRQAEQAERWGFDSFFLPETHFVQGAPIPDPMLLLAAVAARTRRIRLGTTSYLLPIRNPVLAAEQVASLDRLCDGRLILGLGRGYQTDMLEVFGVKPADKRARFGEALEAMISAWRGEPLNGGEPALNLAPRPVQQPHPPLWVAAFGPRAIAQIGRLGLPYFASPVESLAELVANFRLHRDALDDHAHEAPATVAIMRTVFISDDAGRLGQIRDKLADLPAPVFRKGDNPAPEEWCLLGRPAEVRAQISGLRERLGMTHLVAVRPRVAGIPDAWLLESFAALAALAAPAAVSG